MMSAASVLPDFSRMPFCGEALDLVGDDGGLAVLDGLEQIGVGHEGDALPPRPVARREMRGDVVVGPEHGADLADQLLLDLLRLGEAALVNASCSNRILRRTISWIHSSFTCSCRSSSASSMALRPIRK